MDSDITIIGAGIIGLAVAAELADGKKDIYILEKNRSHGMGISSRNSEVLHAGLYYPSGSLKARFCLEGRGLIYETCVRNNIPHKRIGKLVIATTDAEMDEINRLTQNALKNGASVSLLDKAHVNRMEPNVRAAGALYSPDTGIVDVHSLMDYYLHKAKTLGGEIAYDTQVSAITRAEGGYRIQTRNSEGIYFEFTTEKVVNAAGLYSDAVAAMIGKNYVHHYCKGEYFSINNVKKGTVERLIYPVPEKNHVGLGVHLTLDLNGRMRLGPDATYTQRIEDYRVDETKGDRFYESAVRFLPFIKREDIIPDMSGIRPKLQAPGEGFRDFIISEDSPGFVNLVGIESPGLTAAPAIARYVKKLLSGSTLQ
ncbi:putative dehydrogenase [Candidatus Sulfobium mesophilum]|uniref:Putative dehydrogenase n=1 Tax=Candidatus Sulfobium mesophilum TaxID=2016548 RepID=A0A2U3QF09_9BACT|nr:putative dehydrogenase [Candidatus Sulfobium mesophilum]